VYIDREPGEGKSQGRASSFSGGRLEVEYYRIIGCGMSEVCVIVVHHKGRRLLERCLRSLMASRGVTVEVIVVENACEEELPEVTDTAPIIHTLRLNSAVGFSAANNLGMQEARRLVLRPEYYLFLNNDAAVEPDTLSRLVTAANASPGCGVVGPRLMIWGAEEHLNSLGLNVTRHGEAWDEGIGVSLEDYGPLPQQREVLAVTGAALMIRAELCDQLEGWCALYEYYFEDIDLCLRARSAGWKVLNVPQALAWHAISATAERDSDFKLLLTWRNRLLLLLILWPWRLLLQIGPRLAWSEFRVLASRLRCRAFDDARLQARAWLGALRCSVQALRLRRRNGKQKEWTRFLRPAGTVPVIRLPELPPEAVEASEIL